MDKINVTQQNIKHKRKLLAQRKRRARLRLLILLLFLGVIVTGVLFAGYALVSLGSKLNQEYQTMYEGYTQRQQMRRGTIDPRFDGYTNVLIVGLDEGVDIYVEEDMNYDDAEGNISIHLPQGYQHLNGKQAQQYLRYRSDDLDDLGRMQRQQRFCKALYQNLLQLRTLTKLPTIAEIIKQRVETSAEIFDSVYLANTLRHLSSVPPESIILPGAPAADDPSIWVLDDAAAAQRIQELFPAEGPSEEK